MAQKAQIFQALLAGLRFDGVDLAGGKIYFYAPGTTTLKAIYVDSDKTTEAANPYDLDANGQAEVFGDGVYDIKVTTSAGVQKAYWENVAIVDVTSSQTYKVRDYASLNAAVSAIGATESDLEIENGDTAAVTGNLTIPANIRIVVKKGGYIAQSTYTITLAAPPLIGRYRAFTGTGQVTFPAGTEIYPEWHTDNATPGTTNMTNALTWAFAGGNYINLAATTYSTTGNHSITTQTIRGVSRNVTVIKKLSGTNPLITITGKAVISDLALDGNNMGGSALKLIDCVNGTHARDVIAKNVGGTDYAIYINGSSTINQHLLLENIDYSGNYGNLFIDRSYYSTFRNNRLFATSGGMGIQFGELTADQTSFPGAYGNGITDIKFLDSYFEGSDISMSVISLRDVVFDGFRTRINAMSRGWFTSTNQVDGKGSECAQIRFANGTITKTQASTTHPIFDINNYQISFSNIHIYDTVSGAGWAVFKDTGTFDFRLDDVTVESAAAWFLFTTSSTGGIATTATNVNYTQGVIGTANWGLGYIAVRQSNLNHSLDDAQVGSRYTIFEHVSGDIDLTNASTPVLLVFVNGTVTDPNGVAVRLQIGNAVNASIFNIKTLPNYANNAAAVSGGLGVGDFYRNGDAVYIVH